MDINTDSCRCLTINPDKPFSNSSRWDSPLPRWSSWPLNGILRFTIESPVPSLDISTSCCTSLSLPSVNHISNIVVAPTASGHLADEPMGDLQQQAGVSGLPVPCSRGRVRGWHGSPQVSVLMLLCRMVGGALCVCNSRQQVCGCLSPPALRAWQSVGFCLSSSSHTVLFEYELIGLDFCVPGIKQLWPPKPGIK